MKIHNKQLFRFGMLALATVYFCNTAHAQTNVLIPSAQQLTFNTLPGTTTPSQAVLVQSSGGPANVTVSAFSENNWLQVTPATGTTPFAIFVSIGPSAPTTGTDIGFVNLSSSGSSATIQVILNANSTGGASRLSANPNSLSFTFPPGSSFPATQTVTVASDTASVTSFTARPIINNGGSWLTVAPTAGTLPGSFQVSVNPSALPGPGLFNAAIALSAPGTTGISIPVVVTLAGPPAITVSPEQLSFAFQTGTSAPAAQTLSISSSTGVNVGFSTVARTTTCGGNWIVLSQQTGATPSTISVQVNTASLSPGTCTGEIEISAPNASNPTVRVPINLLVSANPLLLVPSTGPTFNYQLGSTTPPAAQNVQITSSSTALAFTAAAASVSGAPNFLQVTPATGNTPQALALSINPAVLSTIGPGTYSSTVTITAAGAGNSPQTFPVTLVVSSNPVLTSNLRALNFNYQTGQAQPQNQTLTISSTGAPLNFQVAATATSCAGFLAATPSNGSTSGFNQVVVSVNTTGITPQVCSGNITLSVPGSTTPALVIPVTLNVSSTPLLNVSQQAINVIAQAGSGQTTQSVSVTSTDPNTQLPFTALAATNPAGLTWLGVVPNSGNTPNNLSVSINPANLAVGTYSGSITVSSTAPNVPAQTIPVTLVVASSTISATPTSLTFTQSAGGSAPPAQTVTIAGVPSGTTIGQVVTVLNGSGWLTASVAGNALTVTANGSQLQQGTYAGVVTVIVPGAANSPLNVPVTLTVGAAPTLVLAPATLNFTYQARSTTFPPSQNVQVTSTGINVPFAAAFASTTGGAFATVTPASGNTPGTITIALNQAVAQTLQPGTYAGTVTVSSSSIAGGNQTVAVNLTVTAPAGPALGTITNSASLQPGPVSPGELVTLFGTGVGPVTGVEFTLTPSGTMPTTLGNVRVTFNGVAAPLLFVRADVINAVVPYEMNGQTTANVVVEFGGVSSLPLQVRIVDTAPAIFTQNASGNGAGSIRNQDQSLNTANNPAPKGSFISVYGTGEGALTPGVATGSITPGTPPFPMPIGNVSLTIGGLPAEITYAGEAPTLLSGLLVVVARVPENVASGNQRVVLTVGPNTNVQQNVTVAVQ